MSIPITQRNIDIMTYVNSLLVILVNIGMIVSYDIVVKEGNNPIL